jgi:glycosyltransferase involved in cell wall biosynthesis
VPLLDRTFAHEVDPAMNDGDEDSRPLVSVVVPCYNSAGYLTETLRSLLGQSYRAIEIVLVDDGSTDDTPELAAKLDDDRVRYFRRSNSGRPSIPRNDGLGHARGKYVALCDSDDLLDPLLLEKSVAVLEGQPSVALTFSDYVRMDEQGRLRPGSPLAAYDQFQALRRVPLDGDGYRIEQADAYECLIEENFIRTSGVVMRREALDEIGPFDQDLPNGDDRDMWLRLSRRFDIAFIDFVGVRYRCRESNISSRGGRLSEAKARVMRKQLAGQSDRRLVAKLKGQIALNLAILGYHHQLLHEMRRARGCYVESLRYRVSRRAIKGLLVTLMGRRLYGWIRGPMTG